MRKNLVGKKQTIETLINEEVLLLAKFLRNEHKNWKPRIAMNHSWLNMLNWGSK